MKNKMASTRKLGLIAGTAVTLGALVGGCPQPVNSPPNINLSERNGTEIRTTNSEGIAEEYGWDQAIVLPINRDDVYNNDEKFTVTASDSDGPMALTGNVFPYDGTVGVHIEQGRNTQNTLDWNISLSGSNIPRGTYPLFELRTSDGLNDRTVGVLGAISRGQSFETPVDPNEPEPPYTIGDGVCSPGEPADSPDCVVEPPYTIGDGICSPGEPASSPDCQTEPPVTTRLGDLPAGSIDMQIYEGTNQLPDVDTANPIPLAPGTARYLTAKLTFTPDALQQLGTSIDDVVVSAPSIEDIMPSGELNGIYVTNIGQTTNPSTGVYTTPFTFVHSGVSSPQVEDWVTASYDLTDPSGTFHFEDRAYFAETE